MRVRIIYIACNLLWALTLSCSDADNSADKKKSPCLAATTVQSWEGGINTIFSQRCGSCHPGQQTTDYKTYSTVKSGITAEMVRINNKTMPPDGSMTDDEIAVVKAWVDLGLPETDADIEECSK